jgi:murein DD-endopeptidase MepM/ murein hydrolase activator NlpD
MRHLLALLLIALAAPAGPGDTPSVPAREAGFVLPCEGYAQGLRGRGNFGAHVTAKGSPFHGSWHLAEDVWLPVGTPVRAVADGVVRYSAFSPTWTDERGATHWNLGNVIVIEHALAPAIDGMEHLCSFYVHLAADRRAALGERVVRGQVIGRIGADRSEENGRYPAHLHFGLHRGAYLQIPPAFERELRRAAASEQGLRVGPTVLRGELELRRVNETSVLVKGVAGGGNVLLSLLVGSTALEDPPPDIMSWCEGYGPQETLAEWIEPSTFLAAHAAPARLAR